MRAAAWARWAAAVAAVAVVAVEAAGGKKKARRASASNVDAANLFSGVTPSGATKWHSDSAGSIYTVVDTSHLKFDRVPMYFCTVVGDGKRAVGAGVNATLVERYDASGLANVTGKTTPTRVSNTGFRVRLKNHPSVDTPLSELTARVNGWRVRWVAVTDPHSVFEAARAFVKNEKYDMGIEEKPVGQSLAYIQMLDRLVNEDKAMVQAVVGPEFQLPQSQRPKKKKEEESADKKEKAESADKKENEEPAGKEEKEEPTEDASANSEQGGGDASDNGTEVETET